MPTDPIAARFGRSFRSGDVLFREGEMGEEMFVIQSGRVQLSKLVGTVERPIAVLGRGEFLGEMAILNNKPRTATASALDDLECVVVDAKTLESMVIKNGEIALRLIKKLSGRLDAADSLIELLLNPDPKARTLLALKRHAQAFGDAGKDGSVQLHVTTDGLAKEVGVNAEQVLRVISTLHRLEIAQENAGAIVINDFARFLEFLDFLDVPAIEAS